MKVLLIGAGGREYALARSLYHSPLLTKLYLLPSSDSISQYGEKVGIEVSDITRIVQFCMNIKIDLVVIGPEQPLSDGLADALEKSNIPVFGPGKEGAQLEISKVFAKDFCKKYSIPTAQYITVLHTREIEPALDIIKLPCVIKADGIAAGKGVIICTEYSDAVNVATDVLNGKFGSAGSKIVIEEYLEGKEVSYFALVSDGVAIDFGYAHDYKKAGDNDAGLNTGGMGAYAITPFDKGLCDEVMQTITIPTLGALADMGIKYRGVLYMGLMLTKDGIKLIEYNVRFGDPEIHVLLPLLKTDILELLYSTALGKLSPDTILEWNSGAAVSVIMATKGYPGSYKKLTNIHGIEKAQSVKNILIFHAGTQYGSDNELLSNGGRVLSIVGVGDDIISARKTAYDAVEQIDWPDGFYRRDIACI